MTSSLRSVLGVRVEPEDVEDILDKRGVYLIRLRDGRVVVAPKSEYFEKVFWEVKIRNRRRAFGI